MLPSSPVKPHWSQTPSHGVTMTMLAKNCSSTPASGGRPRETWASGLQAEKPSGLCVPLYHGRRLTGDEVFSVAAPSLAGTKLSQWQSVSCDGRGWDPYNRSLSWLLGCLFYHHRGNVCLRNKTQDRVESWNRLPPKHLLVKKGLLTVGVSPPVFPAQRGVGRYLNPSVITLHIKFCILNFSFKCSK